MTDYGSPLDVARRYQAAGAAFLHVVDLDGAFGSGSNSSVVARITQLTGLPVQVGGGIRTRAKIREYMDKDAARIVLGTAALEDPDLVAWAAETYPGRIAAGLDGRGGRLAVRGWVEQSDVELLEAARRLCAAGVGTIVYTDIGRDGMMAGPDIQRTRQLVEQTSAQVIGSGGISRLEDVAAMRECGASGCIIGRALLDGAFTLGEAAEAGRPAC